MLGPVQRDILPVLDTNAYGDGDVLFAPVEISDITPGARVPILLQSVFVVDESDQGAAFDLHFYRSRVTLGSLNGAPSITDADQRAYQGRVQIASGDYYDMGGSKVADLANIGKLLASDENSRSLWVAGISRGAGTYAASGLRLRLGFLR